MVEGDAVEGVSLVDIGKLRKPESPKVGLRAAIPKQILVMRMIRQMYRSAAENVHQTAGSGRSTSQRSCVEWDVAQ